MKTAHWVEAAVIGAAVIVLALIDGVGWLGMAAILVAYWLGAYVKFRSDEYEDDDEQRERGE